MNLYKNLSIITVILYLFGVLITLIYLFSLQNQFAVALPSIGAKLDNVSWIFYNTYLIVGLELIVGMGAILFLFLNNQKKDKVNIVYVDKYTTTKEKEDTEEKIEEDAKEYQKDIQNIIKSVKETLSGKKDIKTELDKALSIICNEVEASQGAVFLKRERDGKRIVRLSSSYAYNVSDSAVLEYEFGEGLTGQAAKEGKFVKIDSVPEGYIKIFSGLGNSSPSHLVFVPIKRDTEILGVLEIAAFKSFSNKEEDLLKQLSPIFSDYIGKKELIETAN